MYVIASTFFSPSRLAEEREAVFDGGSISGMNWIDGIVREDCVYKSVEIEESFDCLVWSMVDPLLMSFI